MSLLSSPRALAIRGVHTVARIVGLLPVLVLLAGDLLGIEPLLHLFPIPEEAVEGQANGLEATGGDGPTINLGDGVTHEFVVLQKSVKELHLRAKLRCGKDVFLRPLAVFRLLTIWRKSSRSKFKVSLT